MGLCVAATPLKEAVIALIDERGGLEPIYERIAAGEKMADIAASYTPAGREKPISRPWFYWLLTRTPELKLAYEKAMELKADTLIDDAAEIVDCASTASREDLQKADMRAKFRVWWASKLNRKTYGDPDKNAVAVNVNIETLHIDALRRMPAITPGSGTAALPVKAADIISVEETNGSEDHGHAVAGGQ